MAVPSVKPIKSVNHIHRRVGHVTVAYNHYIIVWGGFMADRPDREENSYCPTESVWLYNSHIEIWTRVITTGEIPSRNSGSTGLVCGDDLYVFGGIPALPFDLWCYSNKLYRLNLKTYCWVQLHPFGDPPLSCDKGVGWVYKNKLYFFGGYGEQPRGQSYNFSFSLDIGNLEGYRGWNNQLLCYDPSLNAWLDPKVRGIPPGPRAAHAADISGDLVFIFGGRFGEMRNNELHVLDLKNLMWKEELTVHTTPPLPSGRSWHSFNFVAPNHAIVYGGLSHHKFPSRFLWDCFISSNLEVTWRKVQMEHPLVWHNSAYMPFTGELIIVGGVTKSPYGMIVKDHVVKLMILRFQPLSLVRQCLNVILAIQNSTKLNLVIPKSLIDILSRREIQAKESFLEANPITAWSPKGVNATRYFISH